VIVNRIGAVAVVVVSAAWAGHGEERLSKAALTSDFIGADDGIRTRDPHLGKPMILVRLVGPRPVNRIYSVRSSAQSAEYA
jgi:hypothetical protein